MKKGILLLASIALLFSCKETQPVKTEKFDRDAALYKFQENTETRWVSFENSSGAKGAAGIENKGAKGHPCDDIPAGTEMTIMDFEGSGIITRMWFTINDRSPEMLRSLKIEMFWDGEDKPAVSAPFGDFFGVGLGQRKALQNAFFADAEGRSFNCFIQMPFKKSAKVVVTNESKKGLPMIFYDINLLKTEVTEDDLYFHCFWNRENPTTLAKDYSILPKVEGKGRFLGSNIGVIANPEYESWWGEGEVKMYIDGDGEHPTLCGTGTEDYIGTAWGQGEFINQFTGCPVADEENNQFAFYRYHVPDPIYFTEEIKVTIQQIGGNFMPKIKELQEKDLEIKFISMHKPPEFIKLLEEEKELESDNPEYAKHWVNFYRVDDWSSTAYFYLDKPSNNLPDLPTRETRTASLKSINK